MKSQRMTIFSFNAEEVIDALELYMKENRLSPTPDKVLSGGGYVELDYSTDKNGAADKVVLILGEK